MHFLIIFSRPYTLEAPCRNITEVSEAALRLFRGLLMILWSPGTTIAEFCPSSTGTRPLGAFLLQKGKVGLAGRQGPGGGSRRPGSHRSLCSGLGELGLKLREGCLQMSSAPRGAFTRQPLAARGVLKSDKYISHRPGTEEEEAQRPGQWSAESKAAPAGFGKREGGQGEGRAHPRLHRRRQGA